MFLPGRSLDDEKVKRQKAYKHVEDMCSSLIASDTIRQACIISVQEVVCGDPSCAPIDTMITLSFESGGQGMFALPMEPNEVTIDVLKESFPPEDVLTKWMNGEDVEWPPFYNDKDQGDTPMELRFDLGTSVLCRIGPDLWEPGTITKLWYRERQWPADAYAPYQIELSDGRMIFAPFDSDQVIRLNTAKISEQEGDTNTQMNSS